MPEAKFNDPKLPPNFWAKINIAETGCWLWMANTRRGGYGRFKHGGFEWPAHRLTYERLISPIPDGLQIDHLCRIKNCVNPAHLEPVTQRENMRRSGVWAGKGMQESDACIRGHAFTPENTYHHPQGYRICRTCGRERTKRWYENNRKQPQLLHP